MAVCKILKYGDPRLLEISETYPPEKIGSPEFINLVNNLFDTMLANEGAGLAAPQIGVPKKVLVYGVNSNMRYPHAPYIPRKVLVNPNYQPLAGIDVTVDWEGCLSVPHMKGKVARYNRIRYSAYDSSGVFFTSMAEGFHARVLQHEIDHLNGMIYPMRIKDLGQFGFIDAFADH